MLVGLIIIGYPSLTEGYGYLVQYRLNQSWETEMVRQEELAASAETEQVARLGNEAVSSEDAVLEQALETVAEAEIGPWPATKITIPKIEVEQVVLDDVDPETLKNGPGHYKGTVNPGERGTVGIAGHRVTYTHPFNRVDELSPGDVIQLETLDNVYEYRVVRLDTLEPDDLSALVPKKDNRARLTLTTCTPKFSARFRLDVQASLAKVTPRHKPTILRRLVRNIVPDAPNETPQNAIDVWIQGAREAVAIRPNDASARIELGVVYRRLGRHEEAIDQLERATELDPDSANAYFQLASVYSKTKATNAAIDAAAKTISLEPGYEAAYYLLGTQYLAADEPQAAANVLLRAIELNSLSGDTYFLLGQAYEKLEEISLAREAYEAAIRYVPDLLEAKAALRRLKRDES